MAAIECCIKCKKKRQQENLYPEEKKTSKSGYPDKLIICYCVSFKN